MMKQIAVYSTVHGRPRRVQIAGTGKELYTAMQYVSQYPPKQQVLTISAVQLLKDPWRYLDRKERWDRRPDARS